MTDSCVEMLRRPVGEALSPVAMRAIWTLAVCERLLPPVERDREPAGVIRTWVVWLARSAGFRPSKRQPLRGATVLRRT
ncbi:MAG: hypothetical protein OXN89_21390 [Bryobacterales bacterium]|nr:hypothetical protein [Bryobacterales bacterium]